jgi:hypothetical protein
MEPTVQLRISEIPQETKPLPIVGPALLEAISKTKRYIRWVRIDGKAFNIEPNMALAIARAGRHEGSWFKKAPSSSRHLEIREMEAPPKPKPGASVDPFPKFPHEEASISERKLSPKLPRGHITVPWWWNRSC